MKILKIQVETSNLGANVRNVMCEVPSTGATSSRFFWMLHNLSLYFHQNQNIYFLKLHCEKWSYSKQSVLYSKTSMSENRNKQKIDETCFIAIDKVPVWASLSENHYSKWPFDENRIVWMCILIKHQTVYPELIKVI